MTLNILELLVLAWVRDKFPPSLNTTSQTEEEENEALQLEAKALASTLGLRDTENPASMDAQEQKAWP